MLRVVAQRARAKELSDEAGVLSVHSLHVRRTQHSNRPVRHVDRLRVQRHAPLGKEKAGREAGVQAAVG